MNPFIGNVPILVIGIRQEREKGIILLYSDLRLTISLQIILSAKQEYFILVEVPLSSHWYRWNYCGLITGKGVSFTLQKLRAEMMKEEEIKGSGLR